MIEVSRLSYRYPSRSTPVLEGIDLELHRGEILLLLGPNGSGKTTLAKLISGLLRPSAGEVRIDGLEPTTCEARRRVGFLFQNPTVQVIAKTVAEDVALGPHNFGLPEDEIRKRVELALRRLQIAHLAEREVTTLSYGELQRVALAGLLALEPDYLILDEPCAQLDLRMRAAFLEILRGLREAGHGILLISQDTELLALADRVAFLRAGHLIAQGTPQALLRDGGKSREIFAEAGLLPPPVLEIYYRLKGHLPRLSSRSKGPPLQVAELVPKLRELIPIRGAQAGLEPESELDPELGLGLGIEFGPGFGPQRGRRSSELLHLGGVSYSYRHGPVLEGISLKIFTGELLGLTGPNGAGKSTLVQGLAGLLRPRQGRCRRGQGCRVGLVFQDPSQSLFAETVATELTYALRERGFNPKECERRARRACAAVGLDFDRYRKSPPLRLSHGEQVKLGIAALLALEPEVLILDETLSALDPVARAELGERLLELNRRGTTVLIVAHRFGELLPRLDRLLVLDGGKLVGEGPPRRLLQEGLQSRGLIEFPAAAQVSTALGLPPALSVEELLAQLRLQTPSSRLRL